jgi:glycine dehydrogenase subunit 2
MEPIDTRKIVYHEPPVFELGAPGRCGASLPELDVAEAEPGAEFEPDLLRQEPAHLPELSEVEVVRHYTRLSQWNHSIDAGFYPLGSCTMKYNPRLNEWAARLPGMCEIHPYQPEAQLQGALQLLWALERDLAEIGGFDRVTLQPAAGAHGELTGLMMIRACHVHRGNPRQWVLVPDSAHGTNPASVTLNGYKPYQLASGAQGILEVEDVARALEACGPKNVAAIMMTNPNTLGLYESHLSEIAEIIHEAGAFVYMDGANLNALMGQVKPGRTGVDVMHYNLHKTFSTPHGGGGPGSGPVGVTETLTPFLPRPTVEKDGQRFYLENERPLAIGRVRSFLGNFGVLVKAYTYIREMGPAGLKKVSELAVLNANYIRSRLSKTYTLKYDRPCLHEVVFSDKRLKDETGVTTMDVAKRLIDYGVHPPTVYFPLIVAGALMIEPTETESPEEVERFCKIMETIEREAHEDPERVHRAPHRAGLKRLDEVHAARKPKLRWRPNHD